jgi:protein ImuB
VVAARVTRVACVWVPSFVAAVAERGEPALAERPLVVVRGTPPVTRVVDGNAAAREHGVQPEMTEAQARARCPGLVTRSWSEPAVTSARVALLEAALTVSPRVEDGGGGLVYVDVDGLERLIGDEPAVGARLERAARAVGLPARVAIGGSRVVARVAARQAGGAGAPRVVLVPPGRERDTLAPVPVTMLELSEDLARTLARWGVRSLGEVAALPREGLALRLGAAGLRLHDLALGRDPAPFRPWQPPPFWEEAQGLDWEIADVVALTAVVRVVLERLVARLTAAHVAADRLELQLQLASRQRHQRTVALAHPTRDVGVMLALLRHDLEAHPPPAAVVGVAVSVRAVAGRPGQGGLWQPPQPVHRDLAAVLSRLVELVGPDNCGSPALTDSHRPDAFSVRPFAPSPDAPAAPDDAEPGQRDRRVSGPEIEASVVLRRLRPPRVVAVTTDHGRPSRVQWGDRPSAVLAAAGPWRTSGEWWDVRAWARDEWDVLLADGALCHLAFDHRARHWLLDAVYD